jgi:Zn-finger nucleic acid-binding protein
MAELTCPKCESPMRVYERNGVTVDSCTGCRGIFLDRGELERLIDLEGSYYEKNPGGRDRDRHDDDDDDYRPRESTSSGSLGQMLGGLSGGQRGHHDSHHGHHKKRKKKNFLEELFD